MSVTSDISPDRLFLESILDIVKHNKVTVSVDEAFWEEGDFYLVGQDFEQDNFIKLPSREFLFLLQDLADVAALFDEPVFIIEGKIPEESMLSERDCIIRKRAIIALWRISSEIPAGQIGLVIHEAEGKAWIGRYRLQKFREIMAKASLSYRLITCEDAQRIYCYRHEI